MSEIEILKQEILNGKQLKRNDEKSVDIIMNSDLDELLSSANEIREKFCKNNGTFCTIINGKSGQCSENCKFCAQSAHNHTSAKVYDFLDEESLLEGCRKSVENGIERFSIVTAGRRLSGKDFENACKAFKKMSENYDTELCASFGLLDYDDFLKLKESGVIRIHANIETSQEYFNNICTTHSFEDKLNCIRAAKKAGMQVCSGGIIGLGESFKDRISMAFTLAELEVDSIPINVLMPIKGTALENNESLKKDDVLRTIALFRFINPKTEIRFAAGRGAFEDHGRRAFLGGANAAIVGDMLTTVGTSIKEDIELFDELGLRKRK